MSGRIRPVFIFSLPRSGSTLLQRMLASNKLISTASEPWVLLPFLYTLKDEGVYAEYGHAGGVKALNDFIGNLPGGMQDYKDELRGFIMRLYEKVADDNARYYLDKTPRYSLISEEIIELFPEARFIFLWRNPLAVASSINGPFSNGKWGLYNYNVDIYKGLSRMISSYGKYSEKSFAVSYEDLIKEPKRVCNEICEYLGVPFEDSMVDDFGSVRLAGNMGDKVGANQYGMLSEEPLHKWKSSMNNPLRKAWCRSYLRWIGKVRLSVMGYDMRALLNEIDSIPFSLRDACSDTYRILLGLFYCTFEPGIFKRKVKGKLSRERWHVHR